MSNTPSRSLRKNSGDESKFVTVSICPAELELGFDHAKPSRRAGAPKIRKLVQPRRVVGDGSVLICHVSRGKMRECKNENSKLGFLEQLLASR